MTIPNKYLNKINQETPEIEYKNERDELVKKTVERIREERKGKEWEFKLVTTRTIAIMFNKKFSNNNYALYIFLTKCNNSKIFSASLWSGLKNLSTPLN
jgi:hypothetical protein